MEFNEKALKYLAEKKFDEKYFGDFYLRKGQLFGKKKIYGLALGEFLKAQEIYLKNNSIKGLQAVSLSLANLYFTSNQNLKAIKYALKAKQYAEELKNNESIGVSLNSLANIYQTIHNTDSAMYYYKKAYDLLRLEKKDFEAALTLDNIAFSFLSSKK